MRAGFSNGFAMEAGFTPKSGSEQESGLSAFSDVL
jgi:hypothetical protein